jgi:hypothetical protein
MEWESSKRWGGRDGDGAVAELGKRRREGNIAE